MSLFLPVHPVSRRMFMQLMDCPFQDEMAGASGLSLGHITLQRVGVPLGGGYDYTKITFYILLIFTQQRHKDDND